MTTQPVITDVSIKTVVVPINPPHQTASGLIAASPLVLIDITCANGLKGYSIVFTYTPAALKPLGDLINNLKPLIVDKPLDPSHLYDTLQERCRLIGAQGLIGMAIGGLDMALWDALARHQELPLRDLLGGGSGKIAAYGGTGYDGELNTAQQAEDWVAKGFKGVKAKIGYPTVEEDLKVVQAMREAVGDDIAIMVDYNQSLTPNDAIERIRQLDEENLCWVEEPVLAHDFLGSAKVRQTVTTPLQSGENWWGPLDMTHAIDAGASDYVMPDVQKIGGITGWRKAVALAEANEKRVSSHLWPEVSAQLLSVGSTSHWLEYIDWWAPILKSPLVINKGLVVFDEAMVGSGVEWNMKNVDKYQV